MPRAEMPRFFRLLLIEDDVGRVSDFRAWCPAWVKLVWAQSAGAALGLIRRDSGRVYGGYSLTTISDSEPSQRMTSHPLAPMSHLHSCSTSHRIFPF